MKINYMLTLSLPLLLLVGCNAQTTSQAKDHNSFLMEISGDAPKESCPDGGIIVTSGQDLNGSGALEGAEILSSQAVCHGKDAGPCAVEAHPDGGYLITCEGSDPVHIQNGTTGASGAPGADGEAGNDGSTGADADCYGVEPIAINAITGLEGKTYWNLPKRVGVETNSLRPVSYSFVGVLDSTPVQNESAAFDIYFLGAGTYSVMVSDGCSTAIKSFLIPELDTGLASINLVNLRVPSTNEEMCAYFKLPKIKYPEVIAPETFSTTQITKSCYSGLSDASVGTVSVAAGEFSLSALNSANEADVNAVVANLDRVTLEPEKSYLLVLAEGVAETPKLTLLETQAPQATPLLTRNYVRYINLDSSAHTLDLELRAEQPSMVYRLDENLNYGAEGVVNDLTHHDNGFTGVSTNSTAVNGQAKTTHFGSLKLTPSSMVDLIQFSDGTTTRVIAIESFAANPEFENLSDNVLEFTTTVLGPKLPLRRVTAINISSRNVNAVIERLNDNNDHNTEEGDWGVGPGILARVVLNKEFFPGEVALNFEGDLENSTVDLTLSEGKDTFVFFHDSDNGSGLVKHTAIAFDALDLGTQQERSLRVTNLSSLLLESVEVRALGESNANYSKTYTNLEPGALGAWESRTPIVDAFMYDLFVLPKTNAVDDIVGYSMGTCVSQDACHIVLVDNAYSPSRPVAVMMTLDGQNGYQVSLFELDNGETTPPIVIANFYDNGLEQSLSVETSGQTIAPLEVVNLPVRESLRSNLTIDGKSVEVDFRNLALEGYEAGVIVYVWHDPAIESGIAYTTVPMVAPYEVGSYQGLRFINLIRSPELALPNFPQIVPQRLALQVQDDNVIHTGLIASDFPYLGQMQPNQFDAEQYIPNSVIPTDIELPNFRYELRDNVTGEGIQSLKPDFAQENVMQTDIILYRSSTGELMEGVLNFPRRQ